MHALALAEANAPPTSEAAAVTGRLGQKGGQGQGERWLYAADTQPLSAGEAVAEARTRRTEGEHVGFPGGAAELLSTPPRPAGHK